MAVPLCILLHICVAVHPPGAGNLIYSDRIGVNYGRVADNLPAPSEVVSLLHSMNIRLVKLFDANSQVLTALSNSSIRVTIMVRNEDIGMVSSSEENGDEWVKQNVLPYYPSTQIIVIVVGNEIFSYPALAEAWQQLVPAMENLQKALVNYKLDDKIKVTTSCAADVLATSFPPSDGKFRSDIRDTVIKPTLKFLDRTGAPFYINLYPYFAWANLPANISLEYALGDPAAKEVKDGKLKYKSLLDAMVDATYAAMEDLGYGDVALGISETGWPTAGGVGATPANAARYNRRLVQQMVAGKGTPRKPGVPISTFIFALFNEDLKPGPATEKNWGLLFPDGKPVYQIDMTGRTSDSQYSPQSEPMSVAIQQTQHQQQQKNNSSSWCVAKPDADKQALQVGLDYVCGQSVDYCQPIQADHPCYLPNTLISHASYAFNSYWQGTKSQGGECSFSGTAILTNINPSYGSCIFPSSG